MEETVDVAQIKPEAQAAQQQYQMQQLQAQANHDYQMSLNGKQGNYDMPNSGSQVGVPNAGQFQSNWANQANAMQQQLLQAQQQNELAINQYLQQQQLLGQQQLQTNVGTAQTPQTYQGTGSTAPIDFNQIYSAYQSQYGNNYNTNNNASTGEIKKTSLGTSIVTPTANPNTVEGQYQGGWASTVNSLGSEMLRRITDGFSYDPSTDNALKAATEYAASSSMEQMAARGILNSSMTSERVAKVVSELIPVYEEKAHDRWIEGINQLMQTAQFLMSIDAQEFEYWKDAENRRFEKEKFNYQKEQDALDNAWKRVDQMGIVDNEASIILGVPAGTLSKAAREAKEEREFKLQYMREENEIQHANNVALATLKQGFDLEQMAVQQGYTKENMGLQHIYTTEEQNNQAQNQRTNATHQGEVDIHVYNEKAKTDTTTSSSKSSTTSLSTHDDIIKNNSWVEYDDINNRYVTKDNDGLYNYIKSENQAGRLSSNDAIVLMNKYGVKSPTSTGLSTAGNEVYNTFKNFYNSSSKSTSLQNSMKTNLAKLKTNGAITENDYNYIIKNLGL